MNQTSSAGCGVAIRHIELDDCSASKDCLREYHLYLPSILCGPIRKTGPDENDDLVEGVADLGASIRSSGSDGTTGGGPADIETTEFVDVGTLPLVFAVHCFGCSAGAMGEAFGPYANDYNSVLVVPVGINNSFNARHCCGYALENGIDDVSFFEHIVRDLSRDFSFVRPDSVYAVGWSNGGFMVFEAASLFAAISPISGYLSETASELKKEKVFCVDGVCVKAKNPAGRGLFIHHGTKDTFVKQTGCCSDPDKPKCCCGIEADTCVPIKEVAVRWAIDVNSCLEPVPGDSQFVTSFADGERGITCLTASGTGCVSNTTLCLHSTGHFNDMPSFCDAFSMCGEVLQFFAQDACDGTWLDDKKTCECDEGKTGVFCLDESKSLSASIASSPIKLDLPEIGAEERADFVGHSASAFLLVAGLLVFVLAFRNRLSGRNKKSDVARYELVPRRSRN